MELSVIGNQRVKTTGVRTTGVRNELKAEPMTQAVRVLNQALTVAETMDWYQYKAEALTAIASQYAQLKQNDRAEQVLDRALKTAKTIRDDYTRVDAVVAIASQYAELGQKDKANKILAKVYKSSINTSRSSRNPLF